MISTIYIEHTDYLRQLFPRLEEYGRVVNPTKCEFGVKILDFLGHHVDTRGIQPLPEKVKIIQSFPQATTAKKHREFFELGNIYRRFIPQCAHICEPLYTQYRSTRSRLRHSS